MWSFIKHFVKEIIFLQYSLGTPQEDIFLEVGTIRERGGKGRPPQKKKMKLEKNFEKRMTTKLEGGGSALVVGPLKRIIFAVSP